MSIGKRSDLPKKQEGGRISSRIVFTAVICMYSFREVITPMRLICSGSVISIDNSILLNRFALPFPSEWYGVTLEWVISAALSRWWYNSLSNSPP